MFLNFQSNLSQNVPTNYFIIKKKVYHYIYIEFFFNTSPLTSSRSIIVPYCERPVKPRSFEKAYSSGPSRLYVRNFKEIVKSSAPSSKSFAVRRWKEKHNFHFFWKTLIIILFRSQRADRVIKIERSTVRSNFLIKACQESLYTPS